MHPTTAFVITVLPFLVTASPVTQRSTGIPIPISKRFAPSGVVDAAKLRDHLDFIQAKYDRTLKNFETRTGRAHPNAAVRGTNVAKRSSGSDSLTDDSELLWYGTISIGTPSVDFTVDFDTGSSDLFVPDASCTNCGSHTTYDPSLSSSSSDVGKTFTDTYGDGSTTSGEQYADDVTVADFEVVGQIFGSATVYSTQFQNNPSDGLMGFAYPALSAFPTTPFFNNLVNAGVVDGGQFSFYLNSTGSELYLGGANSLLYTGDFNWNEVTVQGYWQISMDSINLGGSPVVTEIPVVIDTGTTLILGDTTDVQYFYSYIPGSMDASSTVGAGFYTFPCASIPDVSVTFSGISYTILAANLVFGTSPSDPTQCVGTVVASSVAQDFWIMGDAFMKNVYTCFDFDYNQVGFANLISN